MSRRLLLLALLTTVTAVSCGSRDSTPTVATGADVTALPTTDVAGSAAQTGTVDAAAPTEQRRFIGRSNASFDDTPGERIDLTIEGNSLRFPASCNTARVPHEVIDGVLHLDDSQWSTTAMACSPEAEAAAPRFGELLDSRPTFTIAGDVLSIRSSAEEVELLDASAPHPDDLPLIGVDWIVWLVVKDDTGGSMSLMEPPPVVRFAP